MKKLLVHATLVNGYGTFKSDFPYFTDDDLSIDEVLTVKNNDLIDMLSHYFPTLVFDKSITPSATYAVCPTYRLEYTEPKVTDEWGVIGDSFPSEEEAYEALVEEIKFDSQHGDAGRFSYRVVKEA